MFNWFTNLGERMFESWERIIAIIGAVIIVVAIIRFLFTDKKIRKEISVVLSVVVSFLIIISGVISFTYINAYYSASGGVRGKIGKILMPNSAEEIVQDSSITIQVDDIAFVKQLDETYASDIQINNVLVMDYTRGYSFYINGMETDLEEYSSSHLKGSFTQLFYLNRELNKTSTKKINYTIFFYETYIDFDLYLENDIDSVSLWNSYFDKNSCVIDIKENPGRSDNFNTVALMIENEEFKTVKVKQGTTYILPETFEYEDVIHFCNWELDGVIVKKVEKITSDLIINLDSTSYYFEQYSDNELLSALKKYFNTTDATPSGLAYSLYARYSGDLYNQNKYNFYQQADYIFKALESLGEYDFPKYDESLTEREFLLLLCGYAESQSDLEFDRSVELYPEIGEEGSEGNVELY